MARALSLVVAALLVAHVASARKPLGDRSARLVEDAHLNPGPPGPAAPNFNISLNDPPEKRWSHIVAHYKNSKQAIVDYFTQQVHSKEVRMLLEEIGDNLDKYLGELGAEMRGIAEDMGIDIGIVTMLNFGYELRHLGPGHPNTTGNATTMNRHTFHAAGACTSIVVQHPSPDGDGYSLLHGRNLDWNLPDELRHLVMQINVMKDGKHLFTGTGVAGFVGFLNGMTEGGFSGSINERLLGGSIAEDSLQALLNHAWSPTHLLRKMLTDQLSYLEALDAVIQPVTAPVYFILGGVARDEGSIVTRDRNKVEDGMQLESSSSETNSWYLLETNYDLTKEPEPYDNRRKYGRQYMAQLGRDQATTYAGLMSVLSTWPIRNNETTWTTMMSAKTGLHQTFVVYL